MVDERERTVEEFIEGQERSLREAAPVAFDETMLHQPATALAPREPILVDVEAPIAEAIAAMQSARIGCVLVSRKGKLEGIFTERDVLTRVVGSDLEPATTPVERVMTADPEALRPTDSIAYVLNAMSMGGYRHVPLVNAANEPIGVVSVRDVVNYLVRLFPKSVMNLPTLPRQNYVREREGP